MMHEYSRAALYAILLTLAAGGAACTTAAPQALPEKGTDAAVRADARAWGELLARRVDEESLVDYSGLRNDEEDMERLEAYLAYLASVSPDETASREAALALWINAYNAAVVAGVLANYPIESVKDVEDFWRNVSVEVGGKEYSLAEIENFILRRMDEPRIHWALARASRGGPALLGEPYAADRLNEQLDRQEKAYLRDRRQAYVDKDRKLLMLSSLFYWYGEDFIKAKGTKSDYIRGYLVQDELEFLENTAVSTGYIKYDWSLNEQKK
jgi:hypothetical protein